MFEFPEMDTNMIIALVAVLIACVVAVMYYTDSFEKMGVNMDALTSLWKTEA